MSSTASPRPRTATATGDRLAALPNSPVALFTYGTLTFPEVLRALLGRVPASEEASVDGWRAVAIPDRSYPALVPGTGCVRGRVLLHLRPEEWQVIDAYEDDIYELRTVPLRPPGHRAVAYVSPTGEGATDLDWDRDRFAAEDLAAYVQRCAWWKLHQAPPAASPRRTRNGPRPGPGSS